MNAVTDPSAALPAKAGEIIAGKFRVERLIAQGGDGCVMLATHLQLDERVALKFLTTKEPERALQEARICLRLKTRYVARVMDVGRHGDTPFIVMEHLEGKDLQTMLAENGRLDDMADAVELVTQICEAVAEAHRAGIIHRDIKLANLFLVASRSAVPQLKLLDFGIATHDGAALQERAAGTLQYMAPEALQGVVDDPRSDLWAIGVVLFELLTGVKPFASQDAVSLIADIYEAEHPALRTYREDLPEALEQAIDKCLEKDCAFRFQTAGELAAALRPFAPPRAHVAIDRAIELSSDGPSSARMLGSAVPPPPSSSRRSLRDAQARSSGSLRSITGTTSQRLRSPTTRSGSSLSLAAAAAAADQRRKTILYAVAGVMLVGLGTTAFVVRSLDGGESSKAPAAPSAKHEATTPPVSAFTPIPELPTPTVEATTTAVASTTAPVPGPAVHPGTYVPPRAALPPTFAPVPTAKRSAAPVAAPAPAPAPTPSAAPATTGVAPDPWKANKPKLEDNPFK